MGKEIADNATVEDVLPTLSNPDGYVSGVFGRLNECKIKHGNAAVRIGTTGQGLIPYYRVVFTESEKDGESIFGAYYGDNHNFFETNQRSNSTWSTSLMSHDDVRLLLGKIRGWKGKKG